MQKLFLLITFFFATRLMAQDTSRANAEITNATVFYGYGAELIQQAKIKVSTDSRILIINGLSTTADPNSLQVSCPADVTLMSQRYNVYYPEQPVVPRSREAEKLEDSIRFINNDISRINNIIAIEQETLLKTGNLIETTINTSGNKTVASMEVLKLLEFYTDKIERSRTKIYNEQQNIRRQNERIDALRKKLAAIDAKPTNTAAMKPYGQLILQVMSKRNGEIPVSLSYYTRNAGWMPTYDIRVNSANNKVKLVYKASLSQTSGIDWKKTKLTLSTGTPNFGVSAPILTAWYLQLYVPELYNDYRSKMSNVRGMNSLPSMADKQLAEVVVTNANAYSLQKKDYNTVDPSTLTNFTTLNEGQLNTNYEIDLPYDIECNGQMTSVTIKEEMIGCTLKNYAVPRLEKEAYLLAEISDWENLDLLPGDANIIMDETYIGKSVIDPNITADTMNLSLGRDKRISVKRSVVKELSSLKSSGGNNKQSFTYEIIVKNNKSTDVDMLLKDQYPISNIKEVEVKLEDDGNASVNEELGILTWKIKLKSGESKKIRFSYAVKYPKDKRIINLK
jgi:uncharacterized protein (TIGR02231 family)